MCAYFCGGGGVILLALAFLSIARENTSLNAQDDALPSVTVEIPASPNFSEPIHTATASATSPALVIQPSIITPIAPEQVPLVVDPQAAPLPTALTFPTLPPPDLANLYAPFDTAMNVQDSYRGVLLMNAPSLSGQVNWYTPAIALEITFAQSGGYPAWRLDSHEIAFGRLNGFTPAICRYSVLVKTLRDVNCPAVEGFLPLPTIPGSMWDPVVSPDGTRMAFVRVANSGTRADIVLRLLNDYQGVSEVTVTSGGFSGGARNFMPAWSPNGASLAFVSALNSTTLQI